MTFTVKSITVFPMNLTNLYSYQNIKNILRILLIDIKNDRITSKTKDSLLELTQKFENVEVQEKPEDWLLKLGFTDYINHALTVPITNTKTFFELITQVLN